MVTSLNYFVTHEPEKSPYLNPLPFGEREGVRGKNHPFKILLRFYLLNHVRLSEAEIEKIRSILTKRKGLAYAILFGSATKHLHNFYDLLIKIFRPRAGNPFSPLFFIFPS